MTTHLADTDSYKLSHASMYPPSKKLTAYFTFRGPLSQSDQRIVWAGFRWLYDNVISVQITEDDIIEMDRYTATHMAGGRQFPWPRDLWVDIVANHKGYIPLTIRALRDGETVYPQTPCFIISASDNVDHGMFAHLVTWFETQLMRVWSTATTATKSAHIRDFLARQFDKTVDENEGWRLNYALHDFGSRGVSSKETAITAGLGHLVVFDGTDNIASAMQASEYNIPPNAEPDDDGGFYLDAQGIEWTTGTEWNVGQSVIASEHSVMTSWDSEEEALERLIEITPEGGILSCVADSYDYENFCTNIVPAFVDKIRAKNIYFVLRPDSGDPVEAVLFGLRALHKAFGITTNSKGYMVINGAGVIQGDGIDMDQLIEISNRVEQAGYSAQCVVYGMGGGLLQKQNRDTLRCAIKLCERIDYDNVVHPIAKMPKTDPTKGSMPGDMQVNLINNIPMIYPKVTTWEDNRVELDMLELVWDCGPVDYTWETFNQVRNRFLRTWKDRPKQANPISSAMQKKIFDIHLSKR